MTNRTAEDLGLSASDTTVADELALVIATLMDTYSDPNRIADVLVRTGWTNPMFPYLAELPLTRAQR
jgi:hypothetical protein